MQAGRRHPRLVEISQKRRHCRVLQGQSENEIGAAGGRGGTGSVAAEAHRPSTVSTAPCSRRR